MKTWLPATYCNPLHGLDLPHELPTLFYRKLTVCFRQNKAVLGRLVGGGMSIFEDTNPRELKELLRQIDAREAALPDFQRDFVWDPNATQELIVSIACNFPAGSLLRIRNTREYFACREFQGAPDMGDAKPVFLVLDGQQRLTSLYQAFFGKGDHRYFLRIGDLLAGKDFEESIFHLRSSHRRAQRLDNFEVQAKELILPLSVLRGGAGGFGKWMIDVALKHGNGDTHERLTELGEIQAKWIQVIDDYRFPVVTLSDETSAEAVCTIFETLNRTGVKLSPFELLTARFWPRNVNLRQHWDTAREKYPLIADFDIDPYYLLQIVSLAARSSPSCKRSDVLDLETRHIEEWWDKAVAGLALGLEILRDDCGVLVPKWLPYNTLVVPLGAILALRPMPGTAAAGALRHKIVRWLWCTIFGQTYENAPNSQAAKDVTELLAWIDGGDEPETVSLLKFDPRLLRDTTPRQRALYRGTICLVLCGEPRDFFNGKPLTGTLIEEAHVDDHHLFPFDYLNKLETVKARQRDCILNRTLIDRATNQRISNRAPSDYMSDIRKELGNGKFDELLRSHKLPAGDGSPFWTDNFDTYLDWRQEALWGEIKRVTGIKEASDLIEEEGEDATA
jgi:hypothetical protein